MKLTIQSLFRGQRHDSPKAKRRSFPTIQDVPNNTLFRTHGGNGPSLFVRNQSGDLRLCLNAGAQWSKLMGEEDFPPSSGPFSGPFAEVPWSEFPQPVVDPFTPPAPVESTEDTDPAACFLEPISSYRTMSTEFATEHFGFPDVSGRVAGTIFTASDESKWTWDGLSGWDLCECPPAPAEPAEEETKVERKSPELWYVQAQDRPNAGNPSAYVDTEERANYYAKLFLDTGYLTVAIHPPVVPAPTETEFERGVRAGINEYRLYFLDENEGAIYQEVPVAELDRAAEGAIAGALRDNGNSVDAQSSNMFSPPIRIIGSRTPSIRPR